MILFLSFLKFWFAASDDFVLIPEANNTGEVENAIRDVWSKWGEVWKKYNDKYEKKLKNDLWAQIATGIMWWDTILLFLKYLIKWLSQLGMVIGALMIIYAWYIYATAVFTWNATKWSTPVKNAIIWIIIIISSYVIMKILVNMFL